MTKNTNQQRIDLHEKTIKSDHNSNVKNNQNDKNNDNNAKHMENAT